MKIKSGFILREVADTYVVVPTGDAAITFSGMITLNSTCAFLWNLLQEEQSVDSLVEALCEEYDVDREVASKDVLRFVEQLKEQKFINE